MFNDVKNGKKKTTVVKFLYVLYVYWMKNDQGCSMANAVTLLSNIWKQSLKIKGLKVNASTK